MSENIAAVMAEWIPAQFYPAGSIIQHDGEMYVSTKDTESSAPSSAPEDWVLASPVVSDEAVTATEERQSIAEQYPITWRGTWLEGQMYMSGDVVH